MHQPNEGLELLYTRDCTAWPETLENLRAALTQLELEIEPKLVAIDTLEQAHEYNFFASPTVHVDGVDVDPKARRVSRRNLGVGRPYFFQGRSYPVPPTPFLIQELRELYLRPAETEDTLTRPETPRTLQT